MGEAAAAAVVEREGAAPDAAPRTDAEYRARLLTLRLILGLPTLGFAGAVGLLAFGRLGWADAVSFAGFYLLGAIGITAGYHRLFTHRSYEARPWLRAALACAGAFAVEGPAIDWIADHRRHHANSDEEGDPHSPLRSGSAARGLWYGHLGWLFDRDKTNMKRFAPDALGDPLLIAQKRWYLALLAASLLLPALVGFAWSQDLGGALRGFVVAGLARVFVGHHVTWSVNSVCHVFGRQRFRTRDGSRDNVWLVLPTLGESWHNGHHAFPTSAVHGLGPYDVDPTALVIALWERLGFVSNVKRPTPAQLEERRLAREGAP